MWPLHGEYVTHTTVHTTCIRWIIILEHHGRFDKSWRDKSWFAPKLFAKSENTRSAAADEGWISRIWWKALAQVGISKVCWLHHDYKTVYSHRPQHLHQGTPSLIASVCHDRFRGVSVAYFSSSLFQSEKAGSRREHWLHKPGVLGSFPGDCRPFHFPLFSPLNI